VAFISAEKHCPVIFLLGCSSFLRNNVKILVNGLESLHVIFNVIEKRGPVFLPLVFASLYKYCWEN